MNTKLPSCGPSLASGRTLGRAPGWALALSVVVAFAAGGCTNKSQSGSASENPAATVNGGGAGGSGANQSGSGANGDASLPKAVPAAANRILTLAHGADTATFTATYVVRLASGKGATTRLAQRPPNFGFKVTQGKERNVVISDGKVMNGCISSSGKAWRCTQSSVDDPTEVANTYPQAVLHLIDGLVRGAGREIKVGTSTRTVRGSKVGCATFQSVIENAPPPQIYCIRKDGVLAYARTIDGQVLELTGFKSSVASADLAVPR